jgi:hypothetical protein
MAPMSAEYMREWRAKNREKVRKANKAWRESNKDKVSEHNKSHCQTPSGKKSHRISTWKRLGLIHDDYNALYESYLQATHCNACKSEFKDSFDRNMDHDHNTGLFRQFLCRACNARDSWLKYQTSS